MVNPSNERGSGFHRFAKPLLSFIKHLMQDKDSHWDEVSTYKMVWSEVA